MAAKKDEYEYDYRPDPDIYSIPAKTSLRFDGYLLLAIVILIALAGVLQIFGINEAGQP